MVYELHVVENKDEKIRIRPEMGCVGSLDNTRFDRCFRT